MDVSAAPGLPLDPAPATPGKTKNAAREFESLLIGQLLQPMFETVEVDPLTGGGQGEQMVRSLLVDEYGKLMTASGGIGLSQSINAEILKIQETSHASHP